jgi:hypothetical protein
MPWRTFSLFPKRKTPRKLEDEDEGEMEESTYFRPFRPEMLDGQKGENEEFYVYNK